MRPYKSCLVPQWVFLKKDYADNPTIELKEIKNGK